MEGSSTGAAAAATGGNGGNAQATQAAATENTVKNNEVKETKEDKEQKKEKSQRDMFYERHKADYPDDDEKDEELFYKRHNERRAEYDKLKKSDSDFRKLVHDHPQYGAMFLDAADGKDFMESFLGRFSKDEIMEAYDDPEKSQALSKRYNDYLKGEEDGKKFREEGDSNIKDTLERFKKFCEKNGIEDDEKVKMWDSIIDFYSDGARGKFSDKLFEMFHKAATHDTDVENARREGEVAGHNAKVQTTLAKGKEPKGIPPTFDGGQGSAMTEPKPKSKKVVRNPFTNEDMEFEE